MGAPDTKGPSAPAFFFSFAHQSPLQKPVAPTRADRAIRDFFTQLSEDVAQLLPSRPGDDPGFMDLTLEAGSIWSTDILRAAGTCPVFVAMLSPAYFNSNWCAMEWDLFQRRVEHSPPGSEVAIIPVRWIPMSNPMPASVSKRTIFHPTGVPLATEQLYREHGVFGLRRFNRGAPYTQVIWMLAREIVRVHNACQVTPMVPSSADGLRETFEEDA